MKRYFLLLFLSGTAFANGPAVVTTGEAPTFYKVSITSSTAATVSAYGSSRNRLVCRNTSNVEVYLGSSTAVVSQHANSYEVGPSTTNAGSLFDTSNKGTIYGIAKAGASNVATITVLLYCVEER
jgi:hypothetical protein